MKKNLLLVLISIIALPLRAQWSTGLAFDNRSQITQSPISSNFIIPKVGYRFKRIEVFTNTSIPYFSESQNRPNWTAGFGANVSLSNFDVPNPILMDSTKVPLEIFASVQFNLGHGYFDRDDYLTAQYDEYGSFLQWEREYYEFRRFGNFTQAGIGISAEMGDFKPYLILGIGRSPNLRVTYKKELLENSGIESTITEADYTESPINMQITFGVDYILKSTIF